jgi:atrial natriuretic peptide-converting enzyme
VTRGRLRFRLCQILLNALALLIIASGLAAYFHAYPTIKFVNKTITIPTNSESLGTPNLNQNPAPGVCLPVIVKFCQNHKLPYNFTVFPNYIGHFGQLEAQVELEQFDALVDVQCFELVPLFLCSLFVPKCSPIGKVSCLQAAKSFNFSLQFPLQFAAGATMQKSLLGNNASLRLLL